MELTSQEKELLSYIDSIMPESGHLEFDFRDEKQYAFATMLTKKNFDTERYPGKLKMLEEQRAYQQKNGFVSALSVPDNGFETAFRIPGLGLTPSNNTIASNGIGTVAGGYSSLSLLLFVKSKTTGNIVAYGMNNDLTGSFLPVATQPSASQDMNVTSYLQYSYTVLGGKEPTSGIVTQSAYNATTDPFIGQPVHYCPQPYVTNAINIGLGRPWDDPAWGTRFDYGWNQTGHPTGMIPFVGSVTFKQNIQALSPNNNFLLQIYVADDTNGGTVSLSPTNLTDVYSCFIIDPDNPAKLDWFLPGGLSSEDPGNPITFGGVIWPTDILAYFFCQIIVTLADGSFGSANVQSQIAEDDNPLDGTAAILPISFVWHCLGENTQVTMADGSKRAIQDILAGDQVQTGIDGRTATVDWTNKGSHAGDALVIHASNADRIVTSHSHPFFTPDKLVAACELKPGDTVLTDKGSATITVTETLQDYHEMFYNLSVSYNSSATGSGKQVGSFVANGFIVGDINSQRRYREKQRNDIEWVKTQVPEYLLKDVESYFEDKAKK